MAQSLEEQTTDLVPRDMLARSHQDKFCSICKEEIELSGVLTLTSTQGSLSWAISFSSEELQIASWWRGFILVHTFCGLIAHQV